MFFRLQDWLCSRIADLIVRAADLLPRRDAYASDPSAAGKERILLVSNDFIGDALVRMPLYAALRKAFPPETHHIAVVLAPPVDRLFADLPFFDEIVSAEHLTDSHPVFWIFGRKWFVNRLLRWGFRHKITMLINPIRHRSLGYDWMLRLCRPRVAVAYASDPEKDIFPMTAVLQKKRFDPRYTALLSPATRDAQIAEMEKLLSAATGSRMALSPVPPETLGAIFKPAKRAAPHPYCVMVPGAGSRFRQWPPERFAAVAADILEKHPELSIVVAGTAGERELGDRIVSLAGGRVENMCGRTSLAELGGLLTGARLVVTNETGTATYAAVAGAPVLCIVGGGDFNAFFPNAFYRNTESVFHFCDCFYCKWKCTRPDGAGAKTAPCITDVGAREVCELAGRMLASAG